MWCAIAAVNVLQEAGLRRIRTVLGVDGVRVHNGLTGPRIVRWDDVTGVRVQGRWDACSALRRRNGRDVELPGVPVEVAPRPSRWLGDVRAAAIVAGRPYAKPDDLVSKGVLTEALFANIKDVVAY